jgi:hypothetical protein
MKWLQASGFSFIRRFRSYSLAAKNEKTMVPTELAANSTAEPELGVQKAVDKQPCGGPSWSQ